MSIWRQDRCVDWFYHKINATDDELAALIGHEIAHALRDHGREKVSKKLLTGLGVLAASSAGLGDMVVSGTSLLGDYGVNLPGSRKLESEADLLGVDIMVRAGYNPQGAVSFWNKVVAQENRALKLISYQRILLQKKNCSDPRLHQPKLQEII